MQPIHTLARPIKLFIMDVDGVLTDGSVYITDAGIIAVFIFVMIE